MKKVFALLLTLSLMLPVAALADELIMGTNAAFPPFEYVEVMDGAAVVAGFDVEIGKLVAAKLGMEFRVEDMSFDGLLMALDSGSLDIVLAGMTIRPDRLEQADFSEPYYEAQQSIIVRAGYTDIQTLEDIKTKTVAVQDATTGYYMAVDDLGIASDKVIAMPNAALAIEELRQGRVDCVIVDSAPAQVFNAMHEDIEILVGEELVTPAEYYGIAIKKGNAELLAACNEVLAEIKADGTYDKLIEQFFGANAPVAE